MYTVIRTYIYVATTADYFLPPFLAGTLLPS